MPLRYLLAIPLFLFFGRAGIKRAYSAEQSKRAAALASFKRNYGDDIDKYFATRDASPDLATCREDLAGKIADYRRARSAGDFDKMSEIMGGDAFGFSTPLVDLMQQCGPCIARVENTRGGVYESDGWCRLPRATSDVLQKSLTQSRNILVSIGDYSKDKPNGFHYILAFTGYGPDGKPIPDKDARPISSPFTAFVAVEALFNSSFGYFGDCDYKDYTAAQTGDPVDSFNIKCVTSKRSLVRPPVYKPPQKPGDRPVSFFETKNVTLEWIADGDGNLHYSTSADFGTLGQLPIGDLKGYARQVLMDTVFQLYERVSPVTIFPDLAEVQ